MPASAYSTDFISDDFDGWFVTGDAFGDRPSRAGDFRFDRKGIAARLVSIAPGLAHSGMVSDRLQGVLRSRSFTIESRYIHFLTCGKGGRISVVIDGFEKIRSPIYGGLTTAINSGEELRWVTMDVQMWAGHSAYFEIADGAVVDFAGATSQVDDGHGWIAVDEIRTSDQARPVWLGRGVAPIDRADDLRLDCGDRGPAGRLGPLLAERLAEAVAEADSLDRQIPDPTLAPSQAEGTGMNEHVHIRGSYKNLGEVVPRRFLTVLGGSESSAHEGGSGRDELARRMVDPAVDPLVPRVLVNRLWQHHFGEGIVRSTDDFGAMGQKPSHPELLDWLAAKLVESGWSIKAMHRLMLTLEHLPDVERARGRLGTGRSREHALAPDERSAARSRGDPRYAPRRLGPARRSHVRSERARSPDELHGRPRPARSIGHSRRRRPAKHLSEREAQFPEPDASRVRRAGPVLDDGPAKRLQRARAGTDPLERPAGDRRSPALGRAPGGSARAIGPTAARRALSGSARPRALRSRKPAPASNSSPGEARAKPAAAWPDAEPTVEAWADLCHVLINMKEFIFVD